MSGKVWFVTGASRGLGAEIAKGILAAGNSLVATARNTEALDYLGAPENLLKVALDVTNEAQVENAVSGAGAVWPHRCRGKQYRLQAAGRG